MLCTPASCGGRIVGFFASFFFCGLQRSDWVAVTRVARNEFPNTDVEFEVPPRLVQVFEEVAVK